MKTGSLLPSYLPGVAQIVAGPVVAGGQCSDLSPASTGSLIFFYESSESKKS